MSLIFTRHINISDLKVSITYTQLMLLNQITYGALPGFLRGDGDFLGVVTGMLSLVLSLFNFSCCRSRSFRNFSSCSCFFLSLSILCCSSSSSFSFCARASLSFTALLIALFSWNINRIESPLMCGACFASNPEIQHWTCIQNINCFSFYHFKCVLLYH